MKWLVVIFIFLGFIIFSFLNFKLPSKFWGNSSNIHNSTQEYDVHSDENDVETFFIEDLQLFHLKNDEIYIVLTSATKNLRLLYNPFNNLSLKKLAQQEDLIFMINAGYFTKEKQHAGGLIIEAELLFPFFQNNQLTHVVTFDSVLNNVGVVNVEDFINNNTFAYDFAFQTGPLIISNNVIQDDYINNSINGNELAKRSLMGINERGEVFFIVTRKVFSLATLAEKLLEVEGLGSKISIVNLDGGSSVAMYLSHKEEFQIGENKILPALIGL
jgi:uncharacterized protein YigE (DUF2233 family)